MRVIKKHTNWKNAITKGDLEDAYVLLGYDQISTGRKNSIQECTIFRFKHYDDVLFELYMYELNMMRFQRVHDMNVWERQRYELETQAMSKYSLISRLLYATILNVNYNRLFT